MVEIWIPITVAAAFMQNIRSATQKHLKGKLKTVGATFVRFGFGMPFAALFVAIMHFGFEMPLPQTNQNFWFWVIIAGAMQITAQQFLLNAFSHDSFTVGTAYSRTEAVQAAIIGFVLLGDRISFSAITAIAITVIGVIMLALAKSDMTLAGLLGAFKSKGAQIGLMAGAGFGLSATSYRGASLALGEGLAEPNFLMQAGFTLLITITMQSAVLFLWMLITDRGEISRIATVWKWGLLAGAAGASASFGWFIGFTLQAASVIKALAQVELLFTYASTIFIFKEKVTRGEIAGCLLIVTGILVLVLG
ncbi:MAG: EamA family transporter [Salaquimonas sp.]